MRNQRRMRRCWWSPAGGERQHPGCGSAGKGYELLMILEHGWFSLSGRYRPVCAVRN